MTTALLFVTKGFLAAALMSGFLATALRIARAARLRSSARFYGLALCAMFLWSGVHAQEEDEGAETFVFEAEALNEGLPPNEAPLRLDTPRAALDSYLDAIRQDDFLRAAYALNLDAIPVEQQTERAPELALKLAFILRRHDLIDWDEVSDQPDARVLPGLQQSTAPYARRSVELGSRLIDLEPEQDGCCEGDC